MTIYIIHIYIHTYMHAYIHIGGICLKDGAQFSVQLPVCSSRCPAKMIGNNFCDLGCMSAGVCVCVCTHACMFEHDMMHRRQKNRVVSAPLESPDR